ncbi:unnamed protein product [Closterium sp. NIES-54]
MRPVVAPHQALLAGSRTNLAAASATTSACASACASAASASASACASAASASVSAGAVSPRRRSGSYARAVRSPTRAVRASRSAAIPGADCGGPMYRLAAAAVASTAASARRRSATAVRTATAAGTDSAARAASYARVATAATAARNATAVSAATGINTAPAARTATVGIDQVSRIAWNRPAVAQRDVSCSATVFPVSLPAVARSVVPHPAVAQPNVGRRVTPVAGAKSPSATYSSTLLNGSSISSSNSSRSSSSSSRCFAAGFTSSSPLCRKGVDGGSGGGGGGGGGGGVGGGCGSSSAFSGSSSRTASSNGGRQINRLVQAAAGSAAAKSGAGKSGAGSLGERVKKGALVEFEKEQQRHVVGVVMRPEGKKNWIVMDQNGNTFSVRPQQLTFVEVGEEDFNAADLSSFLSSVDSLTADESLLEMVWEMFLSEQPTPKVILILILTLILTPTLILILTVTLTPHPHPQPHTSPSTCQIAFGEAEDPLVPHFAAHRMLTADRIFFKRVRGAAHSFELRPPVQVEQLRKQAAAEAAVRVEQEAFVTCIREALRLPPGQKPTPEIWRERIERIERAEEQGGGGERGEGGGGEGEGERQGHGIGGGRGGPRLAARMQALLEYAEEKPGGNSALAEESLQLLGCVRTPEAACDLLVRAGALPLHSHSFRLAASAMPGSFSPSVADYSASLAANPPPDPDQSIRVDLTHLKVYTIDSYDTVEVDDGLSAETLPDGRIKVWIHVADPSRWMRLGDRLDTEARKRATSAYFATGAVPMIPFSLAAGPMSLSLPPTPRPPPAAVDAAGADVGAATGYSASAVVCAVTVVVTLNPDFSIDDVDIMNSFICPTYRLAYDQLPEMLAMAGEHEPELLLLSDVAAGRLRYRMQNGAANIAIPESDIKVFSATSHCPEISVSTIDQSDPSRRLVSEAMVLCGEAVARFGAERDLPLPYRGQGPPDRMTDEDEEDMQALPEGPSRAVHLRSFMSRSEIKCSGPIPHAGLGLQGYVQFSSPIRRYSDLLAHYQVKALLRGEPPPLSVSDLDTIVSHCAARQREVRRAEGAVERYWLQEYLRRLPANTVLTAVMLKWLRADGSPLALMLVEEVGMETVMKMQRDVRVGDSVDVIIAEADPARDKLRLLEAPPSFREAQMRGLGGGEEGDFIGTVADGGEEGGLGYVGEDGGEERDGEGESSGEAWEEAGEVEVGAQPLAKL